MLDGLNPFWQPPRLAVGILRRLLPEELRIDILEDLRSRYADLVIVVGPARARRWYWSQTLRSVVPAFQHARFDSFFDRAPGRGRERLATLLYEARAALLQIRRDPGFTAIAVLTLAIGIGATVTVFSAVDVWMFHPLPLEDADSLLHVFASQADRGFHLGSQSLPDFVDFREQSSTMNVAALYPYAFNLSGSGEPERINGERVSWNFFQKDLRISGVTYSGSGVLVTRLPISLVTAALAAAGLVRAFWSPFAKSDFDSSLFGLMSSLRTP